MQLILLMGPAYQICTRICLFLQFSKVIFVLNHAHTIHSHSPTSTATNTCHGFNTSSGAMVLFVVVMSVCIPLTAHSTNGPSIPNMYTDMLLFFQFSKGIFFLNHAHAIHSRSPTHSCPLLPTHAMDSPPVGLWCCLLL